MITKENKAKISCSLFLTLANSRVAGESPQPRGGVGDLVVWVLCVSCAVVVLSLLSLLFALPFVFLFVSCVCVCLCVVFYILISISTFPNCLLVCVFDYLFVLRRAQIVFVCFLLLH